MEQQCHQYVIDSIKTNKRYATIDDIVSWVGKTGISKVVLTAESMLEIMYMLLCDGKIEEVRHGKTVRQCTALPGAPCSLAPRGCCCPRVRVCGRVQRFGSAGWPFGEGRGQGRVAALPPADVPGLCRPRRFATRRCRPVAQRTASVSCRVASVRSSATAQKGAPSTPPRARTWTSSERGARRSCSELWPAGASAACAACFLQEYGWVRVPCVSTFLRAKAESERRVHECRSSCAHQITIIGTCLYMKERLSSMYLSINFEFT